MRRFVIEPFLRLPRVRGKVAGTLRQQRERTSFPGGAEASCARHGDERVSRPMRSSIGSGFGLLLTACNAAPAASPPPPIASVAPAPSLSSATPPPQPPGASSATASPAPPEVVAKSVDL